MSLELPPLPDIFYKRFAPHVGLNVCEEARAYARAAQFTAVEAVAKVCDDYVNTTGRGLDGWAIRKMMEREKKL